jgi:hypothetical protein
MIYMIIITNDEETNSTFFDIDFLRILLVDIRGSKKTLSIQRNIIVSELKSMDKS